MITVENLSKYFSDKKRGVIKAVDDVSFQCKPGEVYGLLGPNGAGKTTTLRLLSTVLRPDSGKVSICDYDVINQSSEVRQHIGFLSGDTGLYRRLSGREILRYFAALYGLKNHQFKQRLDEIVELLEIGSYLDTKTDKLSTGQKQRISIARSVIHNPPVLILDEPTAGLDIIASKSIIDFISRARGNGKTILFSTHVMREAERLCDRIGIIHEGKIKLQGTVSEIRAQFTTDDLEHIFFKAVGMEPPAI
ncbi:ATP-binding cassette domain-containing protein [bacterium]|nr:ATP-binding cassette domain-containing protein [bacterium]